MHRQERTCTHFTGEKTEALKKEATYRAHAACGQQSPSCPGLPTPPAPPSLPSPSAPALPCPSFPFSMGTEGGSCSLRGGHDPGGQPLLPRGPFPRAPPAEPMTAAQQALRHRHIDWHWTPPARQGADDGDREMTQSRAGGPYPSGGDSGVRSWGAWLRPPSEGE